MTVIRLKTAPVRTTTDYQIIKDAPEPLRSQQPGKPKTPERQTMELLEVGDAFMAPTEQAATRARNARYELRPRKYTVRKIAGEGWQVRRYE